MSNSWKPNGHSAIAPYLLVRDARALIRFLEKVFDAKPGRTFERPDGSIMHAEVDIDGSTVMFSDATREWAAFPSMVHVYVRDADATFRRALDAGAVAEQEPVIAEGDTDRRGGFRDPAGNSWWVSTQVDAG